MSDQPDANKSSVSTTPRAVTGIPRWVKVTAIIAIVVVLAFVILHFAGGGFGPGTHGM